MHVCSSSNSSNGGGGRVDCSRNIVDLHYVLFLVSSRSGWTYEVVEPQAPKFRIKTYGENFSWDKKTRVTSK